MLAAFLVIVALIGGSVATYFIMDAPRRRAVELRTALERDRQDLDEKRERFNEEARQQDARARQLAASVAACDRRAEQLKNREAEFDRRAVAYADLAAENRLLRVELKSATVHAAYLEQLQQTNRAGTSTVSDQRDQLGRLYFEEVVAAARKAITPSTYPTNKQRVQTAAARVRSAGVDLLQTEEDRALGELHALFERAVRASVEREEQARLREQMREELARQREAAEAIEQAEQEQAAVEAALQKALADAKQSAEQALAAAAGKHAVEQALIADKHAVEVEKLRAQLAEAQAKAQRAVSQAQLTKAGHVYVISNLGSFGSDMFKIGMTRRLKPLERVIELGDASVPFPFDVHMLIKCDDAPALESALHRRFHPKRVNRVNLRKEFFRVTIEEIIAAVREYHGEVEYKADAEALEYINSQNATEAEVEEIEEVYAKSVAASPLTTAEDEGRPFPDWPTAHRPK